jgi:Zinc binding domain
MSDCCSVNVKSGAAPAMMNCPVNGAHSKQVDMLTVKSLVRHLPLGMPNTQYYFCEAPGCDAVYFPLDTHAPLFRRGDLLVQVGSKEMADHIPVCYCFGFTRKDIQREIAETGDSTIAERITAEVKAGDCACEVKNPSGKCCLGTIARVVKDCVRANQRT